MAPVQSEADRIREDHVVAVAGFTWQPARPPWPPSVEVTLNGRRLVGVAYRPADGLVGMPWPVEPGDIITFTYTPA